MGEGRWICCRQRAGPLIKECRYIIPRRYQSDGPEDLRDKNAILRARRSAVGRRSVDRLEIKLAQFGYRGSHYTLTFDSQHLPDRFDGVRRCSRAFVERAQRWKGRGFDRIVCMEGLHGDHRYHIHMVLRDEDFSPAEVRHLWRYGEVDDEPVLRREGGFRRLAEYFNKERPDGFCIPIGKHPWSCSRGLTLPPPERWRSDSGVIEIPPDAVWSRRGGTENDFGAFRYASWILPRERCAVSDLDTEDRAALLF